MIGIDTNVLIRYIVQDDPRQAGAATRFVERACTAESPGFVGLIVLCECVWVLTSAYGYLRSDVSKVLAQILRVAQFRVENPQAVWRALDDYRDGGADFSDYLIGWLYLGHGCERTVTFDRSAAKAEGFELLR